MSSYFISDLHLEEARPDITEAFMKFIDFVRIEEAEALYILGDFFESWIGDDENTPLQQAVKSKLRELSDVGCRLYFMHGNRDFLVGSQFADETACTILPDPSVVEIYDEPYLLMHGDSLCTRDTSYMKFRQTIRNPAFLEPFLKRPIEDRKKTAEQLRAMSSANNSNKAADIMDVTPEEVVKELQAHQANTMIHGHTHRPAIHRVALDTGTAKRIVLGDWDRDVWFLKLEKNAAPSLRHYPLEQSPYDSIELN